MKLIFDFDDTIFKNTGPFKEKIFSTLEKAGVSRDISEPYYREVREFEFSLKNFIAELFKREGIEKNVEDVYEEIMSACKDCLNNDLVEIVKGASKENCYIVTNGESLYQKDKIERSGIAHLFSEIHTVPGSKKDVIEKICEQHIKEKIIFIDNSERFFADLDMERCKNLKTVLFDENGLKNLRKLLQLAD